MHSLLHSSYQTDPGLGQDSPVWVQDAGRNLEASLQALGWATDMEDLEDDDADDEYKPVVVSL